MAPLHRTVLSFALALLASASLPADDGAEPFVSCDAQVRARPDHYDASFCYYETAKAADLWLQAAEHLENRIQLDPTNHWLKVVLGHVAWWGQGEPERAERLYRAAASAFAEENHTRGQVVAQYNLCDLLRASGRTRDLDTEIDQAFAIGMRSADPMARAWVLKLKASQLSDAGRELAWAQRLAREAVRLAFDEAHDGEDGIRRLRREALKIHAHVLFNLGRYSAAIKEYQRLDALCKELDDDLAASMFKYNIVNTQLRDAAENDRPIDPQKMLQLARTGLRQAISSNNLDAQARLHRTIAELLILTAAPTDEILAQYTGCTAAAWEIPSPVFASTCLRNQAVYLAPRSPAEAQRLIDEALRLVPDDAPPWPLVYGLRARMYVSWETRPRAEAIADSRRALRVIEALRERQDAEIGRAGVFSVWTEAYYQFSGRLLEGDGGPPSREDLGLAFEIAERMRARVLLEVLENAGATSGVAAASDPLLTERILPAIEQDLAPNEAMLSFQVGRWRDIYGLDVGGAWLLVSTREGTRAFPLPDRMRLRSAVDMHRRLFLRRRGPEAVPAASDQLFRILLQEALRTLPPRIDRLILVPDGTLHLLPFSALAMIGDEPLALRYRLSVVPSATLWQRWKRSRPARAKKGALVLADPSLPRASRRPAQKTLRSLAEERPLGRLPYARQEGRAVVRHLGELSRLRLGAEASEHFLKHANLRPYGLLHFASHAVVNEEQPERSAVRLAPGSDQEDGAVQPSEIVALDLRGQVVVLSACGSASGGVLRGEGVMSLARTFFQAGAQAVVGTLWRVRDEDTASFFDAFYRHLAEGMSLAAAVQAAQLERRVAGAPVTAWAGVVVLGDGDVVPLPGGHRGSGPGTWYRWLIVGLAVLTVVLMIRAIHASRRAS